VRNARSMSLPGWIAVSVVAIAAAVGAFAILLESPSGQPDADVVSRFQLDLDDHVEIPEELYGFEEVDTHKLTVSHPAVLAVGPDGRIYVGGDNAIEVLTGEGDSLALIPFEGHPASIALRASEDSAGRIYVSQAGRIHVLDDQGKPLEIWNKADRDGVITCLAFAGEELFAADAGNRVVKRFDASGRLISVIGADSPDRDLPGFVIPSPYFDLAVGTDQLLHVANTGMRRIETYSLDGQLQSFWGTTDSTLAGFFGCCNPAHFAILPDGSFVTSEKGIPRVKVYSPVGKFESVVAGPADLGLRAEDLGDARGEDHRPVFDVEVDSNGNVLVLDPRGSLVRVFAPRNK
jgi:hypothetical protein